MRRPNILFVIADQWRAQAFGYAGDPNVQTPHLDRFERECINFTQAVSRQPLCTPARATLLTGQRPLTHGLFINDVPLRAEAVTIAEMVSREGYATGYIGKWHVDGHGRKDFIPRERRQGFDYWKVLECTHTYNDSPYYADGPEKLTWDGYDAIAQTHDAQRYLEQHASTGQPFLLWLAWGPPHNPYETAPEKYRALYDAAKLKLRPNVPASAEVRARRDLIGYYAHCTALDDCFGELLATLQSTGLAGNTLVVFTSDHGDMLGSQGLGKKQLPYEESVRVPMLLRLPKSLGVAPRRLDATINSEDVTPTLLGLCGVPIPGSVEGLDFSGCIRGGPDPSGDGAIVQIPARINERESSREFRGLRTRRFTYVRDLNGPWLLFDNERDPYQLKNVVNQPEYAGEQQKIDEKLSGKLAAEHDEFRPSAYYFEKWGYKFTSGKRHPDVITPD